VTPIDYGWRADIALAGRWDDTSFVHTGPCHSPRYPSIREPFKRCSKSILDEQQRKDDRFLPCHVRRSSAAARRVAIRTGVLTTWHWRRSKSGSGYGARRNAPRWGRAVHTGFVTRCSGWNATQPQPSYAHAGFRTRLRHRGLPLGRAGCGRFGGLRETQSAEAA
jgi:hypothetical protein